MPSQKTRMVEISDPVARSCAIPGCGRPTMHSSGKGLAQLHCKYHVQQKNRHGSHWHPTYRSADLKPYLKAATDWIASNQHQPDVRGAVLGLNETLAASGLVDPAMNLRRRSAAYRARVAFARLREAGVRGNRLLAIYLAVSALIEDDLGSHRSEEFRIVQAAKAAHRLASGTHRRWEFPGPDGRTRHTELHAYPRSSGLLLRKMGEALEKACEPVTREAVPQIIEMKTERSGPHSSHLPGWRPEWTERGIRVLP